MRVTMRFARVCHICLLVTGVQAATAQPWQSLGSLLLLPHQRQHIELTDEGNCLDGVAVQKCKLAS